MLRQFVVAMLLVGSTWVQAETPKPGAAAPEFSLSDQNGKLRKLAEFRGKWLVLYFYPKNDTPGCTTEACSFRDGQAQISGLGAQVVGVSIDESASHKAFAEKYKLPFPLLADTDGAVAARYGALSDWKLMRFAKRETFLIDPQGLVQRVYERVDPDTHAAQVVEDLRALIAARPRQQ